MLHFSVEYYTIIATKSGIKMLTRKDQIKWWLIIALMVFLVSLLHYTTPTMKWQYHLIFMQSYFIPILLGAFQFGIKGGLGTALAISMIYFPHVMLQWGGLIEGNLMRFLQIVLFNVIGYLTGLKAQKELQEKERYQEAAEKLEDSIKKLQEQSEKLKELEEQLNQADRLAIVGELTASLAHEVRNPLGSIRGVVDILRDELPEEKKTSEFLAILEQETGRLNSVVENYLSFAKKQHFQIQKYDINDLIANVELLLSGRVKKSKIKITTTLPDSPVILDGDPQKLQQVIANLVLNATQAMPNGGDLTIEVVLNQGINQLKEKWNINGEVVCIKISDTGVGIEKQELDKIFKPFYTTREKGAGLGLAIVKRIIEQHKWNIFVESVLQKGSTFYMFIPIHAQQSLS
jgi:signal transduction histidine kinase